MADRTAWASSASGRMAPNTSDQGRFARRRDHPLVNFLGGDTTFYPSCLADGVRLWLGCAPLCRLQATITLED